MNIFPKGVSVIGVVVLGMKGNKVEVLSKSRLANSQVDFDRLPKRADGSVVWDHGPIGSGPRPKSRPLA